MKYLLLKHLKKIKRSSQELIKLSAEKREAVLVKIAEELKNHKEEILEANKKDVLETKKKGETTAFIDRLTLSEKGFDGMVGQLLSVAKQEDVLGEIIEERILENGIVLKKKRFSLGVIMMIYESRPNVTIDVIGICIKSGNAVILKGGSEALHTNTVLVRCVHTILKEYFISTNTVTFLDSVSHQDVSDILKQTEYIDMVIPRGSYALTSAIAKESRIPVMYHASGGARMYVDKSANIKQALEICINAKTQRTGVCNALDIVIVHKKNAKEFLFLLTKELKKRKLELRADRKAMAVILNLFQDLLVSEGIPDQVRNDNLIIKKAENKDFSTEFLDAILAVKVVDSAKEAIRFIEHTTHHHTEILAAEEAKVIDEFINTIDSAALMINCSSRLHDGGEFGLGAEMGIATGKLHARGPVGVKELTTYKWIAIGCGQVRK